MAQKNERTAFTVSNNLKTALIAKGLYPIIETAQSFYSGAANDIHLTTEGFPDGSFRTINITAGVCSFDFIDSQDPALSRVWSERELNIIIAQTPGVEGSSGVFSEINQTWTWTITFNGQNYNGTDASKPDAMAKAFIKVVNIL